MQYVLGFEFRVSTIKSKWIHLITHIRLLMSRQRHVYIFCHVSIWVFELGSLQVDLIVVHGSSSRESSSWWIFEFNSRIIFRLRVESWGLYNSRTIWILLNGHPKTSYFGHKNPNFMFVYKGKFRDGAFLKITCLKRAQRFFIFHKTSAK